MLHFLRNFEVKEQILGLVKLKDKPTPTLDLFKPSGENLISEKVSHYEKFHVLDDGKLTAQLDGSSTTMTVNPELAKFVSKGHVLSIGDEYVMVKSTNTSNNTIEVFARGYADSPKSTHENGSVVYVVSKPEAEGEVTEDYKKTISKEIQNYLQETTKSVFLTKRAIDLSQKDFTQLEAEETLAKINEEGQELNRSCLYGKGKFDPDTGRHTMSGLKDLITKYGGNIFDAEKDLTEQKLDLFIAKMVNKGSELDAIILNPLAINTVFKKMQNTKFVSQGELKAEKLGGVPVAFVASTMGGAELRFIADRDCRPGDMFLVNTEDLKFVPVKDRKSGEDEVFRITPETNNSSAVVNKTIRTSGTIQIQNLSQTAFITNIM